MNLKISDDLKEAMKNGDKFRLSVIRMLKSALQLESISKKHELTDAEVMQVVKRQVKERKDSIAEFAKYGKEAEIAKLNQEIDILNTYLPEEMSEEAIDALIEEIFEELHPTSMKDMGNIMKVLNEKITNADMGIVSKKVKERLS